MKIDHYSPKAYFGLILTDGRSGLHLVFSEPVLFVGAIPAHHQLSTGTILKHLSLLSHLLLFSLQNI